MYYAFISGLFSPPFIIECWNPLFNNISLSMQDFNILFSNCHLSLRHFYARGLFKFLSLSFYLSLSIVFSSNTEHYHTSIHDQLGYTAYLIPNTIVGVMLTSMYFTISGKFKVLHNLRHFEILQFSRVENVDSSAKIHHSDINKLLFAF